MPFEHVVLGAKKITKVDFLLKKFICKNTSDNIERPGKIIVAREVQAKAM